LGAMFEFRNADVRWQCSAEHPFSQAGMV